MRDGIAVAGTITVDEIKIVNSYPEESELTTINSIQRSIGGLVNNCSIGLAKIDDKLPIEIIGLVGNDEKGEYIKKCLNEYQNIDTTQLKAVGNTAFTDVIQNEKNHTRTFFTYKGNSVLFDINTIDFSKMKSKILHIGYLLLLDSLDLADKKFGTRIAKLLKKAQDNGIKTSIDVVSENSDRYNLVLHSLPYTNYCIINEIEAGKIVGIDLRDASGQLIEKKLKPVLVRLKESGVQDWAVIHAPEGSFGYDGVNFISLPSLALSSDEIKGTVGAGDAYASGLLYGAIKGMGLFNSMKLATSSAASSLLKEDSTSGIESYRELINMYESYPKNNAVNI